MMFFEKLKVGIAELLVLDQQPAHIADAPAFENLLRIAARDTGLKTPKRDTVNKQVFVMAVMAEATLREQMKGTRPSLTTDIWTANDLVSRYTYAVYTGSLSFFFLFRS